MIRRTIQKTTRSHEATHILGQHVGAGIVVKTILALTGDLGCGKTAFVQGLARGLEVPGGYYITSPTFTLINRYPGRFPLFHVDLYRIENPFEVEDIGLPEILSGEGVVAIEWADRLDEYLPSEHVALHFEILADEARKIFISGYGCVGVNLLNKLDTLIL